MRIYLSLVQDGNDVADLIAGGHLCRLTRSQFFAQCQVKRIGENFGRVVVVFVLALLAISVNLVVGDVFVVVQTVGGRVDVFEGIAVGVFGSTDLGKVHERTIRGQRGGQLQRDVDGSLRAGCQRSCEGIHCVVSA